MKIKEKNDLLKYVATLSDEALEKEYYETVISTLGSEAEIMEDRGYEEIDIRERRSFEKYLSEKADLLGFLCQKRGIKIEF